MLQKKSYAHSILEPQSLNAPIETTSVTMSQVGLHVAILSKGRREITTMIANHASISRSPSTIQVHALAHLIFALRMRNVSMENVSNSSPIRSTRTTEPAHPIRTAEPLLRDAWLENV